MQDASDDRLGQEQLEKRQQSLMGCAQLGGQRAQAVQREKRRKVGLLVAVLWGVWICATRCRVCGRKFGCRVWRSCPWGLVMYM